MKLRYALFLLTILPALAPAAPAPFPREKRAANPGGWSKPVDGLRVRLLATQTRYRVGETVRFAFEIQNVSDSAMTLEGPSLSEYVWDSSEAPGGWAITSDRRGDRRVRQRERLKEGKRLHELMRLPAGEIERIEIAADPLRRGDEKHVARRRGEPRRERLHFYDANEAGVYELRATYTPDTRERGAVRKGVWPGRATMTSPPVRIELEE